VQGRVKGNGGQRLLGKIKEGPVLIRRERANERGNHSL
jgi:hypothetical protein